MSAASAQREGWHGAGPALICGHTRLTIHPPILALCQIRHIHGVTDSMTQWVISVQMDPLYHRWVARLWKVPQASTDCDWIDYPCPRRVSHSVMTHFMKLSLYIHRPSMHIWIIWIPQNEWSCKHFVLTSSAVTASSTSRPWQHCD